MKALDIITTGMLGMGLLAAVCGLFLIVIVHTRASIAQPDFWQSRFYFPRRQLDYQNRTLQDGLKAENATRTGRLADLFLRWATVLCVIGGLSKAVLYVVERQAT